MKLVLCHFIITTVTVHCLETIFRHGIGYNLATALYSLTQLNALIEWFLLTFSDSDRKPITVFGFQQYFSYIAVVSFIGGGNRSTQKTTDLSQVIDKLYHIMLYQVHLAWAGLELTTLVVIGTDSIGSCKSITM